MSIPQVDQFVVNGSRDETRMFSTMQLDRRIAIQLTCAGNGLMTSFESRLDYRYPQAR